MNGRIVILAVGLILTTSVVFAGETVSAPALPFAVFTAKVAAYYPRLKEARSDVDIALARQMQARAGFWPSVSLAAGVKVSDDPVTVFGMLLRQERFTSSDFDLKRLNTPARHQDISTGLHAEWPLFDAMQTIGRARAAEEALKAAASMESFTGMEALLMAQDAYLNAVMLQQLSSVVNDVQQSAEADIQKARDLKDKGMVPGADYYSARVMAGEFTRMSHGLARQKKAMMILLNILMGESTDKEWMLSTSLKEADMPAQEVAPLVQAAFEARPDLVAAGQRLQAARADLDREQATGLPALSAFGDSTNDRNDLRSSGGNNYTVGLKAAMPLFDRSRAGRVKEARAREQQLEQGIEAVKDGISRDIAEEVARHEAWRDNKDVLKAMRNDAAEAVTLMTPLYNEGRKSVVDLMAARRAYLEVVEAGQKAVTGAWASEGRLLFLTGRLNDATLKALAERSGL